MAKPNGQSRTERRKKTAQFDKGNQFQFTGTVVDFSEPEDIETKNGSFRKAIVTVEREFGKYKSYGVFEFFDKTLDYAEDNGLDVGDNVTVHFSLSGNEGQKGYFPKLRAYKIEFNDEEESEYEVIEEEYEEEQPKRRNSGKGKSRAWSK